MRCFANVQLGVVVRHANPVDLVELEQVNASALFDWETMQRPLWGTVSAVTIRVFRILRRRAALHPLVDTPQSSTQTVAVEWLQEKIHGMGFERRNGVFFVRGNKHDQRSRRR